MFIKNRGLFGSLPFGEYNPVNRIKRNLLCRGSSRGLRRGQRERRGRCPLQTVGSPTGHCEKFNLKLFKVYFKVNLKFDLKLKLNIKFDLKQWVLQLLLL